MNPRLGMVLVVVGLVLHLAAAPFFFAAGLLAPGPVVLLMIAYWIGILVFAIFRRRQPRFVVLVPVIDAVVWFVVIQGGSWIFGWTA
jgi:hypothetical protein